MEVAFSYSGNLFFNILHLANANRFSAKWKLFGECYFTASRNHYWNKEKTVLRVRAHCCYCTTDSLANGNYFFLHFSETLARDSSFSI